MKKNRYALGALAVAVTALASAGSALAAGAPIDEKKASAAVEFPAGTAVQAPLPEVKQKKALTAEEWKAITARLPKAELMNGFSVHSKHFCASCHGKEGLADTSNWPDIAGQPAAVTVKALLDYRDGRRKGTPAADLMAAAAAKLTDQEIVDAAALYAYLPGRNAGQKALVLTMPVLVKTGDASRYITPCAACHGTDASGNPNGLVPVLHGQQAAVTAAALKDYRSGARSSDMMGEMRVFARKLTDAEINEIADWYAAQPGRKGKESEEP